MSFLGTNSNRGAPFVLSRSTRKWLIKSANTSVLGTFSIYVKLGGFNCCCHCRSSVSHRIIIGSTDPVPTAYPEKEVLWGLSDVEVSKTISHDSHGRSISRLFTSASPASDAGDCQLVNLTCSNQQCGLRPLYHNAEPQISEDLNAEGQWPWHVSIHREGDFICGAILISNQWLLITRSCAQHFE